MLESPSIEALVRLEKELDLYVSGRNFYMSQPFYKYIGSNYNSPFGESHTEVELGAIYRIPIWKDVAGNIE